MGLEGFSDRATSMIRHARFEAAAYGHAETQAPHVLSAMISEKDEVSKILHAHLLDLAVQKQSNFPPAIRSDTAPDAVIEIIGGQPYLVPWEKPKPSLKPLHDNARSLLEHLFGRQQPWCVEQLPHLDERVPAWARDVTKSLDLPWVYTTELLEGILQDEQVLWMLQQFGSPPGVLAQLIHSRRELQRLHTK